MLPIWPRLAIVDLGGTLEKWPVKRYTPARSAPVTAASPADARHRIHRVLPPLMLTQPTVDQVHQHHTALPAVRCEIDMPTECVATGASPTRSALVVTTAPPVRFSAEIV